MHAQPFEARQEPAESRQSPTTRAHGGTACLPRLPYAHTLQVCSAQAEQRSTCLPACIAVAACTRAPLNHARTLSKKRDHDSTDTPHPLFYPPTHPPAHPNGANAPACLSYPLHMVAFVASKLAKAAPAGCFGTPTPLILMKSVWRSDFKTRQGFEPCKFDRPGHAHVPRARFAAASCFAFHPARLDWAGHAASEAPAMHAAAPPCVNPLSPKGQLHSEPRLTQQPPPRPRRSARYVRAPLQSKPRRILRSVSCRRLSFCARRSCPAHRLSQP